MNHYEIVIILFLITQGVTLALLWASEKNSRRWQAMWTRDSAELLFWKRHALMRDPKTGRYIKKDRR